MRKLTAGETVFYQGKPYIIEGFENLDKIVCKDTKGNFKILNITELDEEHQGKEQSYPPPVESLNDKFYQTALKRLEIIKPLLQARSKKAVRERAKEYGYCAQTLYNWINAYIESGNSILALMPKYEKRGGKGKTRIGKEQKKIIDEIILNRYLSRQKITVAQIVREINAIFYKKGLEPVSYNTVNRIIKQIDERTAYKSREGRNRYLNNLKPSANSFEVSRPLEVIQIDHTPLDLQIVDETYRKPIGRPYLTLALDVYSRMIYGFHLTLDAPSLYSVGQTLYMGLLPKEEYLQKTGIKGKWNIFGIPDTIHVDNAKEFRSRGLKTFCEIFGINLEFRPKGMPFFGGHVERVIKTVNMHVHSLSGTTFSNPHERGDYKSEKKAVFTLKELESYIAEWIVNIYHKTPHNGLDGMTPEDKFSEGLRGENGLPVPIRILDSAEEKKFARISLLPFEERKITKQGVSLFKLRYYDEALSVFIRPKSNDKYIFRYDPKDLNQIYFYHPDLREYIEIPGVKKLYPPPTKWELDTVAKETKRYRQREIHNEMVYDAILRLRKREEEASKKTKQARRKKENRKIRSPLSNKEQQNTRKPVSGTAKPKIKKFDIDFED
ncbi:Mu transposase C-terminal domain-containing protein [Nitrosophilus labii]|uniref:Mu transposase C-terminal domain-containing protein n=1 Tax=Nitrosophilus labii TaxID=2706014 RepID=UPI001656A76D|nr:Mu transposase C-terminal domain-containing protein [Nitrosophilus labii]